GDDVAVVQRCRRLRLPAEPSLEGRVRGVVDAEHLDRHYPAQTVVTAPAYLGHAATTEDLTQLVAVSEESWLAHQLPLLRICSKRTVPVSAAGALTASLLPIPEHGQHGDQHDNHAYPSNSHQAQPTPRRVSRPVQFRGCRLPPGTDGVREAPIQHECAPRGGSEPSADLREPGRRIRQVRNRHTAPVKLAHVGTRWPFDACLVIGDWAGPRHEGRGRLHAGGELLRPGTVLRLLGQR